MHRKFLAICLTLASVFSILAAGATGHSGIVSSGGPVSNTTGGLGNHTVQVCLHSSFYGGATWNIAGNAVHARLYEAMQTLNGIYGQQAFVTSGSGGAYPCPGADKSLIMKRNNVAYPAAKMQYTWNASSLCSEPWGGTLGCSSAKTITVNDWYLWYVGTGTPTPTGTYPNGAFDMETAFLHELIHALGFPEVPSGCTTGQEYLMCTNLLDASGDAPFYWRSLAAGQHDRVLIEQWYAPSLHQH